MAKIRLDVEGLKVESFATEAGKALRGTVRGHCSYTRDPVAECEIPSYSGPVRCLCNSEAGQETCFGSCNPDMCSFMDSTCCP